MMGSFYQAICYIFWAVIRNIANIMPVPGTTPPPSNVPPPKDSFALDILNYNNSLDIWNLPGGGSINVFTELVNGVPNVIIHKIYQDSANICATYIEDGCTTSGFNKYFISGCIGIESTFDILCENHNNKPGESNPTNNPMGFDMGPCQLKLEDIVAPGVTGYGSAYAFAMDPSKCFPYFFSLMEGHLAWAKKTIAENTSSAPLSVWETYPELLATGAYNFGEEGMFNDYYSIGLFPSHCQKVVDIANSFAAKDGKSPVYVLT